MQRWSPEINGLFQGQRKKLPGMFRDPGNGLSLQGFRRLNFTTLAQLVPGGATGRIGNRHKKTVGRGIIAKIKIESPVGIHDRSAKDAPVSDHPRRRDGKRDHADRPRQQDAMPRSPRRNEQGQQDHAGQRQRGIAGQGQQAEKHAAAGGHIQGWGFCQSQRAPDHAQHQRHHQILFGKVDPVDRRRHIQRPNRGREQPSDPAGAGFLGDAITEHDRHAPEQQIGQPGRQQAIAKQVEHGRQHEQRVAGVIKRAVAILQNAVSADQIERHALIGKLVTLGRVGKTGDRRGPQQAPRGDQEGEPEPVPVHAASPRSLHHQLRPTTKTPAQISATPMARVSVTSSPTRKPIATVRTNPSPTSG